MIIMSLLTVATFSSCVKLRNAGRNNEWKYNSKGTFYDAVADVVCLSVVAFLCVTHCRNIFYDGAAILFKEEKGRRKLSSGIIHLGLVLAVDCMAVTTTVSAFLNEA